MGLTLGWIAVKGRSGEGLLDRLGLEVVGEASEEVGPDYAFTRTPQGWCIVVMKAAPPNMDDAVTSAVPKGSCLSGFMSEHVTASEVRGYRDGELSWSVARDPDQGAGLVVRGAPPRPFDDIRGRLEAKQAAAGAEQVNYLFDAPLELAASLSGYRPAQGGLEWQILAPKKRAADKTPSRRRRSLSAAMKAELLPLLWSLGWRAAHAKPRLSEASEIVREIGDEKQTIWFEFASGIETYITVEFRSGKPLTPESRWIVRGLTCNPAVRLPLWKRLTWTHLWNLTRAPPPPDDPVEAAIARAKAEILAVDAFLKGGEQAPCIAILDHLSGEFPRRNDAAPSS